MAHANHSALPVYGNHKAAGQARVVLGGHHVYLGPYESPASREKYDRLIAEYLAAGRNVDLMPSLTRWDRFCVIDLIAAFKDHAESYYVKNGEPTKTIANLRIACRRLRELYGSLPVEEFGPAQLRAVRETWINDGNNERTVQDHLGQARLPRGRGAGAGLRRDLAPPGGREEPEEGPLAGKAIQHQRARSASGRRFHRRLPPAGCCRHGPRAAPDLLPIW